jgi:hypothetical protein
LGSNSIRWRGSQIKALHPVSERDTRAGLRINGQGQVMHSLYCGSELAGGFNQYGLGRCTARGYIAGKDAGAERP